MERDGTFTDAWRSVAFLVLVFSVNCFILNIVTARTPDPNAMPPLRDIAFEYLPIWRVAFVTEIVLYGQTAVGLWIVFTRVGGRGLKYRIWTRYSITYGISVAIRTICIAVTSLPPTDNHCQVVKTIPDIWSNTWLGLVTGGGGSIHCGDLVMSGHSINITTTLMIVLTYSEKRWLRALVVLTTVISWFSIIMSRSHYTVDVVIAVIITSLVWRGAPELFPSTRREVAALLTQCWVHPIPSSQIV